MRSALLFLALLLGCCASVHAVPDVVVSDTDYECTAVSLPEDSTADAVYQRVVCSEARDVYAIFTYTNSTCTIDALVSAEVRPSTYLGYICPPTTTELAHSYDELALLAPVSSVSRTVWVGQDECTGNYTTLFYFSSDAALNCAYDKSATTQRQSSLGCAAGVGTFTVYNGTAGLCSGASTVVSETVYADAGTGACVAGVQVVCPGVVLSSTGISASTRTVDFAWFAPVLFSLTAMLAVRGS